MERKLQLTKRAKSRSHKTEWLKSHRRYYYSREEEDLGDWKQNVTSDTQPSHSLNWGDICLETGEIKNEPKEETQTSSNVEAEEDEEIFEEEITPNNEELENIIKHCGLDELKTALNTPKFKYTISKKESFNFSIRENTVLIDVDTKQSAYFQVEHISENPPAVIFAIKLIPNTQVEKNKAKPDKSDKTKLDTYSPDNTFRQAIIFKKSSKVLLIHCGKSRYSSENLLKNIFNINSLLQIAPSRIQCRSYLIYHIDVTSIGISELDRYSYYNAIAGGTVLPFNGVQGVSVSKRNNQIICNFSM